MFGRARARGPPVGRSAPLRGPCFRPAPWLSGRKSHGGKRSPGHGGGFPGAAAAESLLPPCMVQVLNQFGALLHVNARLNLVARGAPQPRTTSHSPPPPPFLFLSYHVIDFASGAPLSHRGRPPGCYPLRHGWAVMATAVIRARVTLGARGARQAEFAFRSFDSVALGARAATCLHSGPCMCLSAATGRRRWG